MTLPEIWYLRHGQTVWNAAGRVQGRCNSALTGLGRAQARMQADLIGPVLARGHRCLVSPLGRTVETARIALGMTAFETDPRLAELCAGAGEGLTRAEVALRWPEIAEAGQNSLDLYCALPGAEPFDEFRARVRDVLADLQEPTVIVGHGLFGKVLRGELRGLTRADLAALPNEQGCVYHLRDGTETVLRQDRVDDPTG